ncbi:hypothetical protein HNQ07_000819 [Deinococcus metalli]|uniref:Uncharacterized protein n=1 Tax=Deinococcus metalli TaxID=1141878 RepID=A0A7W8KCH1_9DEIO|nr:hypothetical protein [Deinococcus metalli]MBB5375375.1 hypothetical protein [Deinococcus metalli]GHF29773.1 hypothetical protein GCM10017781_02210 [Deinococcus metalli]
MTVLTRPDPLTPSDPPAPADPDDRRPRLLAAVLFAALAGFALAHLAVVAGLLLLAAAVTVVLALP